MGPEYLRASNGDGPAVRATISSERLPGDMDVITDSVANWPAKGIATSGTPDDDGIIIPDTECVFYYVLSGTIIHITGFAPGYHDVGHSEDQIVIIKPNTAWADELAEATDTIPDKVDARLLPIHTDEANGRVGINKVPTQGALDVDGYGSFSAASSTTHDSSILRMRRGNGSQIAQFTTGPNGTGLNLHTYDASSTWKSVTRFEESGVLRVPGDIYSNGVRVATTKVSTSEFFHGNGSGSLTNRSNETFGTTSSMPSWTFTTAAKRLLEVHASITARQENSAGSVDTEYAIFVGNTLITAGNMYTRTNYQGSVVTLHGLIAVNPGTHTVTVQYRKSWPGTIHFRIYCDNTYLTARLLGEVA